MTDVIDTLGRAQPAPTAQEASVNASRFDAAINAAGISSTYSEEDQGSPPPQSQTPRQPSFLEYQMLMTSTGGHGWMLIGHQDPARIAGLARTMGAFEKALIGIGGLASANPVGWAGGALLVASSIDDVYHGAPAIVTGEATLGWTHQALRSVAAAAGLEGGWATGAAVGIEIAGTMGAGIAAGTTAGARAANRAAVHQAGWWRRPQLPESPQITRIDLNQEARAFVAADGLVGGREAAGLRFFEALEGRFGKTIFEGESGEQVTRQVAAAFDEALKAAPPLAPRLGIAARPAAVDWEPALDAVATQALSTLRVGPKGVTLQRPWFQTGSADADATKVASALFGKGDLTLMPQTPSTPLAQLIANSPLGGSTGSRSDPATLKMAEQKKDKGSKDDDHRPAEPTPSGRSPQDVDGRTIMESLLELGEQASRQTEMGDFVAAVKTSQIEVQMTRAIAEGMPNTRPALALALVNMAVRQRAARMDTESLASLTEAAKLLRNFVDTDPTRCRPLLGVALEERSSLLRSLGRFAEALQSADEAVRLFRGATLRDDRVRLGSALMNQDAALAALGRNYEAVAASAQAVETFEHLAMEDVAFDPNLAESLNNMAIRLTTINQPQEALAAIKHAVALQRRIAAARPGEPRPDLAIALTNLSLHYRGLGLHLNALKPAEEAVQIYRALVPLTPAVRSNYARALNNLAAVQLDLGKMNEALVSAEQAAASSRSFAAESAAIADAELATALHTLGKAYAGLGDSERAVESFQQAVTLYRQLAVMRPEKFGPGTGHATERLRTLLSLIKELDFLGRSRAAYEAAKEAITQIRNMAGGPIYEELRIDLAMKLTSHSMELGKLGWMEEALEASRDAVEILALSVANNPAGMDADALLVVRTYMEACARIDQPVDQDLLNRLAPKPDLH